MQSGPEHCRIEACFDAQLYDLLNFKAISPFFNVCTVWLYTLSQCIAEQNQLLLVAHTKTLDKMDRTLTKERFLLFSQRCILRNTADLLSFMLHSVLSVTSVKLVCCHNAIPHTLRDELMCGIFQLSIWRLTL